VALIIMMMIKIIIIITHPTVKQDNAVPRNANVDIAPKFLKKCF